MSRVTIKSLESALEANADQIIKLSESNDALRADANVAIRAKQSAESEAKYANDNLDDLVYANEKGQRTVDDALVAIEAIMISSCPVAQEASFELRSACIDLQSDKRKQLLRVQQQDKLFMCLLGLRNVLDRSGYQKESPF